VWVSSSGKVQQFKIGCVHSQIKSRGQFFSPAVARAAEIHQKSLEGD
jgi:hypothetical protein